MDGGVAIAQFEYALRAGEGRVSYQDCKWQITHTGDTTADILLNDKPIGILKSKSEWQNESDRTLILGTQAHTYRTNFWVTRFTWYAADGGVEVQMDRSLNLCAPITATVDSNLVLLCSLLLYIRLESSSGRHTGGLETSITHRSDRGPGATK